MTVVILEDAGEDLESGAQFYESCATGVGDYFLDSILSDLDSLVLFCRYSSNLLWVPSYDVEAISVRHLFTRWKMRWSTFMPFWICGAIHSRFGTV